MKRKYVIPELMDVFFLFFIIVNRTSFQLRVIRVCGDDYHYNYRT